MTCWTMPPIARSVSARSASGELAAGDRLVVIDEIQRLPELLNEVLIEARGTKFLLTGSSARKLRRGGVNLLGGRARIKYLHPPPRSGKIYRWPRTPEKKVSCRPAEEAPVGDSATVGGAPGNTAGRVAVTARPL
jgi:hypothetical protein